MLYLIRLFFYTHSEDVLQSVKLANLIPKHAVYNMTFFNRIYFSNENNSSNISSNNVAMTYVELYEIFMTIKFSITEKIVIYSILIAFIFTPLILRSMCKIIFFNLRCILRKIIIWINPWIIPLFHDSKLIYLVTFLFPKMGLISISIWSIC